MISPVSIVNDAENDWIVMRYADVLLMLAEAQGNSAASLALINQTRKRAGLADLLPAAVNTVALFERELTNERKLEFTFENIRWYDLMRYNSTMTTITAEQTIKKSLQCNVYCTLWKISHSQTNIGTNPGLCDKRSFVASYTTT